MMRGCQLRRTREGHGLRRALARVGTGIYLLIEEKKRGGSYEGERCNSFAVFKSAEHEANFAPGVGKDGGPNVVPVVDDGAASRFPRSCT